MSELLTLQQAIHAFDEAAADGDGWDRYAWVYLRGDITQASCRLFLSHAGDEDEAFDDHAGEPMPAFAARHGLRHFLEAHDFAEVLAVERRQDPQASQAQIARALSLYRRRGGFVVGED
ncbi:MULTISPECIES: hypothetical protein [Dyella]|uniref:Uncharacterized protein n=2 Tax=Dyella TaxID=231454 RepID=A0A4R0YSV4_9GAMM|nr:MULTISPECIES: hypothetical protein [Dyella]TBR36762.1 hypothetical protein EYV96_12675 [Dyella terrae]TCI08147.1 hypothetical protein EZM97_26195 [Dyella soli]